jgi:predicted CoA-binding protein
MVPVNPQIESGLGEKAYASLLDVREKIDIVNIVRSLWKKLWIRPFG